MEAWQYTKMAVLRCIVLAFHLEELIDIGNDVVMATKSDTLSTHVYPYPALTYEVITPLLLPIHG